MIVNIIYPSLLHFTFKQSDAGKHLLLIATNNSICIMGDDNNLFIVYNL